MESKKSCNERQSIGSTVINPVIKSEYEELDVPRLRDRIMAAVT
jgi:hypothetical protein